ncbi:hypothetical protein [Desulfosarcina sp.]|uniref:hypothetical protein n=1 Tax=Desulfosarcina sp. TaxID=2027861 RepID=UPI003565C550
MDNLRIAKQMIELNKTAFDNSFSAMTLVYEQNEKIFETILNQAAWMPEAGRKAIEEWLEAYRNGCSQYKKLVDESYAKVEVYFDKS